MNETKIFKSSEFGTVRTDIDENGKVLFNGFDVAKALGYSNQRDAISRHCRYVVKRDVPHPQSPSKTIEMTFVPESDVYRLVFSSKLPNAERFTDWVTEEILPTIRKHGAYMTPEKVEEILLNPDTIIKLATELKEERERTAALNAKIKADKPYTEFGAAIAANSDAILVRDFAKLLHNDGIKMGEKRLYKWLRENGFLMQTAPTKPYQKYVDMGWFRVDERSISTVQGQMIVSTTKITGKGQMALLSALRASRGGN